MRAFPADYKSALPGAHAGIPSRLQVGAPSLSQLQVGAAIMCQSQQGG